MAEGKSTGTDDVVCRYFFSSSCRDGDRCLFSHDSARRVPDNVCRYYLQNKCSFGPKCRYNHVRVYAEANSENCSQCDRHSTEPSCRFENCDIASGNSNNAYSSKSKSNQPKFNSLSHNSGEIKADWRSASADCLRAAEFMLMTTNSCANASVKSEPEELPSMELCSDHMIGACELEEQCPYVHGAECELCHKACLHPFNEKLKKEHIELCEKELEKDMEISFAIQRSTGRPCGICLDVVLEKEPITKRRFGILENCNHVFCLTCIRMWRKSEIRKNNQLLGNYGLDTVTRACPECRRPSDFIIPSDYCVDNEEDRNKLIAEYKMALSEKPCKYFKQGEGVCHFGGACFYLHAKPDGTKVELPIPTTRKCQQVMRFDDFTDLFIYAFGSR